MPEKKLLTRGQAVTCLMQDMPPEVETKIAVDACRTLEAMAADLRLLRQHLLDTHGTLAGCAVLTKIENYWRGTGWLEGR